MLVSIEEPHMYNADDAVARVDSLRGQRHRRRRSLSGERRMVRIESVERSVATAALLDAPGDGAAAQGDGAQLESRLPAVGAVAEEADGAVRLLRRTETEGRWLTTTPTR